MAFPLANIAQLALGGFQAIAGIQGLNKLSKQPYPEYSISPEIQKSYSRAEDMSSRGYSPQEEAAFRQNLAGTSAQRYQKSSDMAGGNLAQAIQGGVNYGNIKGLVNFAADDANLHRRNIQYADSLAKTIQNQRNLITESQQNRRNALEQAYGGGVKTGLENIVNPLNLSQALAYQKQFLNQNNTGQTTFGDIGYSSVPQTRPVQQQQFQMGGGINDYNSIPQYYNFGTQGLNPRNPYVTE